MIAFIIEHHLVLDYPAESSRIVAVFTTCHEPYIGLHVLVILIMNDEDKPFLKGVIKKILYFFKLLNTVIGCVLSQFTTIFIEITVNILEPVE